jgi:hypothetical protein
MSRKVIRTFVGVIVGVFIVAGSFFYGVLVEKKQLPPYQLMASVYLELMEYDAVFRAREWLAGDTEHGDGWWKTQLKDENVATPLQQEEMLALSAIGYLSGTREKRAESGVTVFVPERTFEGLNLYCSGHGPEAILMGMGGDVLHSWNLSYEQAFPDALIHRNDKWTDFWRKIHLYPNGDLLAIFEGVAVVKVDKDSNLIWANKNRSHHDMWVQDNGEVYILTRTPRMIPEINKQHPILEDFISVLGPDGTERRRYSILEAVTTSNYSALMDLTSKRGDIFHTNTVEILDGRHEGKSPAFKSGNALVSLANINTVAVIDLELNRVVWALAGLYSFQHDPTFLNSGNLLLFDNLGAYPFSKVIELDPLTQEISWSHSGDEDHPFFSEVCGTSQRLPNGNTLVTETSEGKAFEVTPEGDIVWEFNSPHITGDHGELVAILPELKRLGPEFPMDWLTR